MRLGLVDKETNTVLFPHHDVEECRAFLQEHRLSPYDDVWKGPDKKGVILPCGEYGWTAAYWYIDEPVCYIPNEVPILRSNAPGV
jgi:hypothetical protein